MELHGQVPVVFRRSNLSAVSVPDPAEQVVAGDVGRELPGTYCKPQSVAKFSSAGPQKPRGHKFSLPRARSVADSWLTATNQHGRRRTPATDKG